MNNITPMKDMMTALSLERRGGIEPWYRVYIHTVMPKAWKWSQAAMIGARLEVGDIPPRAAEDLLTAWDEMCQRLNWQSDGVRQKLERLAADHAAYDPPQGHL